MCFAFMDESGDPGMKLTKGSSALFTVCMVLFQEEAAVDECRLAIRELRTTLGMKTSGRGGEFHFSKMRSDYQERFFAAVADQAFIFFTATITKAKLSGRDWSNKDYMYYRAGLMALDQALPKMLNAKLVFDATSDRTFDQDFLRALKKHAGSEKGTLVIKETNRLESYKDDMIQLADMVCGAVMAVDRRFYRAIQHQEGGRVVFPTV